MKTCPRKKEFAQRAFSILLPNFPSIHFSDPDSTAVFFHHVVMCMLLEVTSTSGWLMSSAGSCSGRSGVTAGSVIRDLFSKLSAAHCVNILG